MRKRYVNILKAPYATAIPFNIATVVNKEDIKAAMN